METEIIKRTFEAKKHPKGSEERKELNKSATTSEYNPSEKFIVLVDGDRHDTYKTRKMAEFAVREIKGYN